MKKFWLALVGLGGLVVLIIGIKAVQIGDLLGFVGEMEEAGFPPVAVASVPVREVKWERGLEFVGTLRAVQGVTLTSEVGGIISAIRVENGAEVAEGDVLFQLDESRELAQLNSAKARARLAKANLERARGLSAKAIIAQAELDTAVSEYDVAQAMVANLQAIIDEKVIRAPFAGRVGIRQVNLGQTVSPGDPLIPLHQNDQMFVDFAVPQTQLPELQVGQALSLRTDGLEEPVEGRVAAINPVISESTRTAAVQGLLANPGEILRPGQFVMVRVLLAEEEAGLAVPQSAVVAQAFGDSVFVVEGEPGVEVVRQQFVQLGTRQGDWVMVEKGLQAGERVVSAGAFKLMSGLRVMLDDAMQPLADEAPTPGNR
jgi:membrane fusion protein (multidrug efflux system)